MSIGIWQLILILVIVIIIFGAGRLPRAMGDLGKSVRSLRSGLKGEDDHQSANPSNKVVTSKDSEAQTISDAKEHEKQSD